MPLVRHQCPATLYLSNDLTTEASRRGMFSNLRRAARLLSLGRVEDPYLVNWPALTNAHVARLRTLLLEEQASPATVNTILAGAKGVLKQAWRLGLIDSDRYLRAVDVKPARGSRVDRKGRCLTLGEVQALSTVCCDDPSVAGARDAALFALAIGGGLRRAELVGLTVADYAPGEDAAGVGTLVLRGKGNKERKVFLHNGARAALADWLQLRGGQPGALFLAVDRFGRIDHANGALSGQAVEQMMKKRAEQAGVGAFAPHDCRRTFISSLLDNGVDISTAAHLAGHASVETTRIYDRRGVRAAIAAAGTVHFPETGKKSGVGPRLAVRTPPSRASPSRSPTAAAKPRPPAFWWSPVGSDGDLNFFLRGGRSPPIPVQSQAQHGKLV